MDHLSGAGLRVSCFLPSLRVRLDSFFAVSRCTCKGSLPSMYPKMRWIYCCGVSCILLSPEVEIHSLSDCLAGNRIQRNFKPCLAVGPRFWLHHFPETTGWRQCRPRLPQYIAAR